MLLCLIYLSLSQKFKTQVIKENKNISLHITICIPHHLNPYTLLGHLCSLFGINFHIPSLSPEHSLLYFMIYLNRSRKAGSSCVPWSPLKWYWLFSSHNAHTMDTRDNDWCPPNLLLLFQVFSIFSRNLNIFCSICH